MVEATPSTRDRYVDFLRVLSIGVVVLGHWLIGVIHWDGGIIRTTSAIGITPMLWLATWLLQVMPVFFFVGGFSNLVSYESARRRGGSAASFVRSRVARLLRPTVPFLAVWIVVQVVLHVTDTGAPAGLRLWGDTQLLRGVRPPGQTVPFGPLWFLGVYLAVVVVSPATIWLHRRFGSTVLGVFVVGAIVADGIGFVAGHSWVRWANVAFVLLLPHQLGHFYADGSLVEAGRRLYWAMVVGGLAALVVLTNEFAFRPFGERRFEWFPGLGHYPRSLLGVSTERVSNANPPTLCYLAVGVWTVGLVMLLRPAATRWLAEARRWRAVIAANSVVMTLFLWHMTAYLLAVLALWPLGLGREQETTVRWWLERFVWVGAPGLVLGALVAMFGRFERGRDR